VLLLLLSLSLLALVSYFVLLICYSAIRLLSHKCRIQLSVSVSRRGDYRGWCMSTSNYQY